MRTNPAIQFRGVDRVMEAFENYHAPRFALFYGNQLLLKNEDTNFERSKGLLAEYLKQLIQENQGENQGYATYTLAVYDKLAKGQRITNKTEYDGSFNFKLFEFDRDRPNREVESMRAQIATLQQQLNEREDDPEPVGGIAGFFETIMKNPRVQDAIGGKVAEILSNFLSPSIGAPALGKVAGAGFVMEESKPVEFQSQAGTDDLTRINNALVKIAAIDPDLVSNLELIADLATKSPEKYLGALNMLKTL